MNTLDRFITFKNNMLMKMKAILNYIVLLNVLLLFSCEDKIDLNLDSVEGKYVIVGDLHNADNAQTIRIHRAVDFSANSTNNPVLGADVLVKNQTTGREYKFVDAGNGDYNIARMTLNEGESYSLFVQTKDGNTFEANCTMPHYVTVDSIGLVRKKIFNDEYLYVSMGFLDPVNKENYYKYKLKVNDGDFKFSDVFSDKFNNGLEVEHEITNEDNDLKIGDTIKVLRQCIAKEVYTYWSNIKEQNPGSAAPANPISNISNGALGYFSVSSARYYDLELIEK
ncbi:DUF4249 domain-containing protein [Sphingobacterium sp. SRCM116780]|uniref:DUF4249 domain-containing protein n=1 Tax=Sphingobacterium sp. SRCM116780 TaxID=2907623 RepID=UPI001F1A7954|nr:DUF4249 domain-containing protein [Sphingobacterium sp. SRCM116780]UIR57143.1 DUF4249 domain-containing protein [Sphingobacterium sp. SRCM116780]